MVFHHKDSDDSGDFKPPRNYVPRKRAAPAKATNLQAHTPKAAKTGGDKISNVKDFNSQNAAPNTFHSHLPKSWTTVASGNKLPTKQVGQPRESGNTRKTPAPTPSTDEAKPSLSVHPISGRSRGKNFANAQLRPIVNTADSIGIVLSTPPEDFDDNIFINSSGDAKKEGVDQFGRDQQQVAFDDHQFVNNTDSSNRSPMAAQVTGASKGGSLSTTIARGGASQTRGRHVPSARFHALPGSIPPRGNFLTRYTSSLQPAPLGAVPSTAIPTITPEILTYGTSLVADHTGTTNNQVHGVDETTQTQHGGAMGKTRSQASVATADVYTQTNKTDGINQPQVNNVAGDSRLARNGMNISDDIEDWPRNVFVALEEYISRNGIWDEMDRLYMMGVQAGIGHGITAHKNCLVTEYQNAGKLWGQDVSWEFEDGDARRSRAERVKIIQNVDIFERLAAVQAANDFISVRQDIQGHAQELASIHHQNLHPAPPGPGSGLGIDPRLVNTLAAPANVANNYSLPASQGLYIPNQTANLTAMAGSQTLGGLNLSQIDGLAGALANSVMGQNQHRMTGTQQGPPNIGVNTNSDPQDPNYPQIKTPTLTETESGRAIIKMATVEQKQLKTNQQ